MEEERPEFFKLDKIDQKVMFWIMSNSPHALYSWIEHIVEHYRKEKSILIDVEKLSSEVIKAMDDEKSLIWFGRHR